MKHFSTAWMFFIACISGAEPVLFLGFFFHLIVHVLLESKKKKNVEENIKRSTFRASCNKVLELLFLTYVYLIYHTAGHVTDLQVMILGGWPWISLWVKLHYWVFYEVIISFIIL